MKLQRPTRPRAPAALALLMLVGCASNGADVRLRKYLRIDPATPLTEADIRTAALRVFSIGSDEGRVRRAVAEAGIGSDELSSYYPADAAGIAHILVRLDPRAFGVVEREHSLVLHFNREHRLQDIRAEMWLTGP